MTDEHAADTFSTLELISGVYTLMHACVGRDLASGVLKLGGWTIVGPRKVVEVKVWGRRWPLRNGLPGEMLTGDNVTISK